MLLCGQYFVVNGTVDAKISGWICRLSPEGEVIWSRSYPMINNEGENRESSLWDIAEMDDGSIVATGQADQWDSESPDKDFWLIKVNADGCFDGVDCPEVIPNDSTALSFLTSVETPIIETHPLIINPNPASDQMMIDVPDGLRGLLQIYNSRGVLITTQEIEYESAFTYDVTGLEAGVYVVEILSEDGRRYVERVVVID